ncbi:hypothetical protein BGZ63DRAFT_380913 [Mariannaea sp. PMI_226]|nr:hypothetical protein BGZ63DRAFT_380913 [Mariannaea sp. PMI_226]
MASLCVSFSTLQRVWASSCSFHLRNTSPTDSQYNLSRTLIEYMLRLIHCKATPPMVCPRSSRQRPQRRIHVFVSCSI